MKSLSRALLTAVAVGAVVSGGVLVAHANQTSAADEQQPLVEDFAYPGKERVELEYGVRLISGDGHVLHVDCAQQPSGPVRFIEVYTSDLEIGAEGDKGRVCFKVLDGGYVTMLLPDVFEIRGDGYEPGAGHSGTAEVVGDSGEHKTVALDPDGSIQVGIGSGGTPETLLRLEVQR